MSGSVPVSGRLALALILLVQAGAASGAAAEEIGLTLPQAAPVASMTDCNQVSSADITALSPRPSADSKVSYTAPADGTVVSAEVQLGSGIACEFGDQGSLTPVPLAFDQYQLGLSRNGDTSRGSLTAQSDLFTVNASQLNEIEGLKLAARKGDALMLNNGNSRNAMPVLVPADPGSAVTASLITRSGVNLSSQSLPGYQIALSAEFLPEILPIFKMPKRVGPRKSQLKFAFKQPGIVSRAEFSLYRRAGGRCLPLRTYRRATKSVGFSRKSAKCAFTARSFRWFRAKLRGSKGSFTVTQPARAGTYFAALRATAPDGYRTNTYEIKQNVLKFIVV